MVLNFYQKK